MIFNNKKEDDTPNEEAAKPEAEAPIQEDLMVEVKASDYQKLQDDLAQTKDKYLRLFAEFDNARKRMERDKQEFVKYANEGLIVEFLNILDDLERSVESAKANHQDYSAFLKGVEMVMAHVYDMLKKNGVKPIEAKGKKFDPSCHEVLLQEETNDVPEATVLEEFQKGYYLGDRVVRTTKVKLAKGTTEASENSGEKQ